MAQLVSEPCNRTCRGTARRVSRDRPPEPEGLLRCAHGRLQWALSLTHSKFLLLLPFGSIADGGRCEQACSRSECNTHATEATDRRGGTESAWIGRVRRLGEKHRRGRRERAEGVVFGIGDVLDRGEQLDVSA